MPAVGAFEPSDAETDSLLGYRVYALPVRELARAVVAGLEEAQRPDTPRRWLACLNPHSYAVARGDAAFADALKAAHWLVPDGAGIVLASRWLHGRIGERITGHDVFSAVSAELNARRPFSVAFVGSTEATLKQIAERYRAQFPNARTLTTLSPPFRPSFSEADIAQIASFVSSTSPDLLWMGLTAPKQELLLAQLASRAQFGFAAGIGAVFDFYVGNVKRSPAVFQRLGLEWLPRLVQQPRRLWRRTFVSAPIFLRDVARAVLRGERSGRDTR